MPLPKLNCNHQRRTLALAALLATLTLITTSSFAQFGPEGGAPAAPVKHADDPIKMVYPVVDKTAGTVTIPCAFWNQKMTSWVEVAVCGRPSDFLHETVVCLTTTKSIMMQAMRSAGFHDADAWVANVRDFPRIRGDRFIILLKFTRPGGEGGSAKEETYALDELLAYQGWGVSAGPYGWMFKGDPERDPANSPDTAPTPPTANASDTVADRTKILRDDPQIALVFKGIQHQSSSFADHPIAYDDWVYPMMRYGRNYRLLPSEIYDSNGALPENAPPGAEIKPPVYMLKDPATGKERAVIDKPFPISMVIEKVTEEQLITEEAKVWHDPACSAYMLKQLPTAKQIDDDKAALWKLLPAVKKMRATAPELRDAQAQNQLFGQLAVLAANIEKGYATLDAAWADWAADHPVFQTDDNKELDNLKKETKLWRDHMDAEQSRAAQLAIAEKAAFDLKTLALQPPTDATTQQQQKLRGIELEARSAAMLAENDQPRDFWKAEQARLDPKTDPRVDWIKHIGIEVDLTAARALAGNAGLVYGRALQSSAPSAVASAQKLYAAAVIQMSIADLQLRIADVDFEISKREGFDNDPDLARFKAQKKNLEQQLKEAQAATQPGPAK